MAFHIHVKTPHEKCIFWDRGHSARNKNKTYLTGEHKHSKFFQHSTGEYHGDGMFEEGTKNQEYSLLAMEAIIKRGINVVPIYHSYKDTPLLTRASFANLYHATIQQGIGLSEHSNAFNSNARGFSVFTSPGYSPADPLATRLIEMYEDTFMSIETAKHSKLSVRKDLSDRDPDYEARFTMLVRTIMPFLLVENLFFDNSLDADILEADWYKDTYPEFIAEWADEICM